jgi:transposase
MTVYIGIDVSKATLDVAFVGEGERIHRQVANDTAGFGELGRWLRKRRVTHAHVCLEATGQYSDGIATFLHEAGYLVSVVNPARVRGYADSQMRRNKTDKLDAYLLADFCQTQQPEAWTPPPPEWRELRALVRHLDELTTSQQQVVNRQAAGPGSPLVNAQWTAQLTLLEAHIAQTKQAIADEIDQHPDLKRQRDLLTSIPGIGDLTAGKLLAECRDLTAFTDVRQLVAFAGLNPRQHQSGTSVHKAPTISRQGSAPLRTALYMPALNAMRFNPLLRTFAARLAKRGLSGKALVTAVMRKLLHLVYGVLKSGQPFDPHWNNALQTSP